MRGYFSVDSSNAVERRTDFASCPRPVLLLYGFMSTRRVFEVLERRLRRDGFGVWSINLGGFRDVFNTERIETLAQKVQHKVERMYTRFPAMGKLSIVGHSKGGLIGADYVKRFGGEKFVSNLITLGTPFNGSPTAYLGIVTHGFFTRSIWQLTPISPYLKQLRAVPFPPAVAVTSIYSSGDRVNPHPACVLETQPNLTNVELPQVAHREFVVKDNVYQVIRRQLFHGYGLTVPKGKPAREAVPPEARP